MFTASSRGGSMKTVEIRAPVLTSPSFSWESLETAHNPSEPQFLQLKSKTVSMTFQGGVNAIRMSVKRKAQNKDRLTPPLNLCMKRPVNFRDNEI